MKYVLMKLPKSSADMNQSSQPTVSVWHSITSDINSACIHYRSKSSRIKRLSITTNILGVSLVTLRLILFKNAENSFAPPISHPPSSLKERMKRRLSVSTAILAYHNSCVLDNPSPFHPSVLPKRHPLDTHWGQRGPTKWGHSKTDSSSLAPPNLQPLCTEETTFN